jgi:hypothetical protein
MRKPWYDGGYSGEDIDDFIALADKYEPSSLLFPLEMAIDGKRLRVGLAGLTTEEQTVLAVEALEREVNNGGFSLFFSNSSGEFTPIIVDCLNRIGCPIVAEITQSAIQAIEREDVSVVLDGCDQQYYSTGENIGAKLFEFIRANSHAVLGT